MKHFLSAIRSYLFFSILFGLIYPVAMTALSQGLFPNQASGSLVKNRQGEVVGSRLIAQKFSGPNYFWPRPSAVDYNPIPSGASNLGPTSQDLISKVNERRSLGVSADLLYASGSGLDPHISPEAAISQVARVARARGMNEADLHAKVQMHMEGRDLGFLGQERINVLLLNLALDQR